MKKFFVPEVVQTSNMDCGPASLKCLLEGFGIPVSYGRLREACQTGIDGTSIDTIETVANHLGLEAEQIILPIDHVLLSGSNAFPAIIVVRLPNGLTHFVVVWRRAGPLLQVMDPAVGRRWISRTAFVREIYHHVMPVGAVDWREFAASAEFQAALRKRLLAVGIAKRDLEHAMTDSYQDASWRALGALDAGVRLMASLVESGGVPRSRERLGLLMHFREKPELIPDRYWSVRPGPVDSEGGEQLLMRGAVLVRARLTQNRASSSAEAAAVGVELEAALRERPLSPGRELFHALWQSGRLGTGLLLVALAAAAGGTLFEAMLFRGLFDMTAELGLVGQRFGAATAVLVFSVALLLLEIPGFAIGARLGRQLEIRLRIAFLEKIPKLGDRYFQSRLISDMAERNHATQRLRHLPDQLRQLLRAVFELLVTAAGIAWLEPSATALVTLIATSALLPALVAQSALAERDLRVRSHAGGLTRFYLDAMLGLMAIRAHSADRAVRREQEKLLGEWLHAALRFQRAVVSLEAVQLVATFGLVALLLLTCPLHGANAGRVLLVVYWALNLPALGQDIGTLARQYPYYRNVTLRLLDPLGALEEDAQSPERSEASHTAAPAALEFRGVTVRVSGHVILDQISLQIEPGSHVAIVGSSGAGKSSLVGVLLGWLKQAEGDVLVDGAALDCQRLRSSTAWVDPAVQLWNRSLLANLSYGSAPTASKLTTIVDAVLLRGVLETLPDGFQTSLGEGGGLVSGGEGQRVRLGRAMLREGIRLVILDEPFRGLDREKRHELLARAREYWRGRTLICITHDVAETQVFDRVLVVDRGRIVEEGVPATLGREASSRYAQLLRAETNIRAGRWNAAFWRRVRVHGGNIIEELPKRTEQGQRETEVA